MHLAFLWEENGLSSSNWKDLKSVELRCLFDHGPQTTEFICSLREKCRVYDLGFSCCLPIKIRVFCLFVLLNLHPGVAKIVWARAY